GHWAWGGTVPGTEAGWLASRGFVDFAGSSVVHSTAGWVALSAVLIVGPRHGRFDPDAPGIEGHNLVMATFGVLLLWFGWFGFNGGSTLGASDEIPLILVNTNLSAAAGGISALVLSRMLHGRFNVNQAMNGVIAGLVAITACCRVVAPEASVLVGAVAGVLCVAATEGLTRLRVDDVIAAVPAHACGGVWGTLAVALLGNPELWGTGLDRGTQLVAQLTGIVTCFIWAFGTSFGLLWLVNRRYPLRVDPEDEHIGLNVSEHGASTAALDLVREMERHGANPSDMSPVRIDPHTEVGAIAAQYNRVVDKIAAEEKQVRMLTAELVEAHNQVTLILDSAGEGIYGLDPEGRTTFANPAAAQMIGWEVDDLIGRSQHDVLHHTRVDGTPYPAEECPILAVLRDGVVHHIRDEVFWRKDGTSFPVEYVSTPMRGAGGEIAGAVVTFRDLTEQQSLEAQLVQAQKLESIGQLAAGIAHEINTPSQYVGDNVEFLDQSFNELGDLLKAYRALQAAAEQGDVPAELLADVNRAADAADIEFLEEEIPRALIQSREGIGRVTKIVRAMKEFSHPASAEKQSTDLNRAIESTITVASSEWKHVAEMELKLDPALPRVPCLVNEFNQVVLNIVVNAAHALGDQRSESEQEKGKIRICTAVDADGWAVVEISDDGPGMPEEVRSKVFDPFFTTKEVGKGTGQGLAIARSVVVDKHDGTIDVESELGHGTRFRIRLPLESDRGEEAIA
ncbi:MAG: ATP-binding protein, partial [Proteobacteria bacterium]|nr:ATP-binding protein [Pseudomonadota bacterium]